MRILKIAILIILLVPIPVIITIWMADRIIEKNSNNLVYNDANIIPANKTGLLLGTCKTLNNGLPNEYFTNRIRAAADLYNSGKIQYIVISGDNGKKTYNEPLDMKNELIRFGIPAEKIFLDHAGFRTYDSVIRMNKIFGQKSFTVISQDFHNRRAVFIAKRLNLNAIGYNAKEVNKYYGFKTILREKFARVKVFTDLLFNKKPKFLGEKVVIE
jgi:SanA protein